MKFHGVWPSGQRRQTVEQAVGTLKAWMGATHLLTKTLQESVPR